MDRIPQKADRRARGRPRAWADKTDQNRIKALDRAMQVLETLAEMGGATLGDLAGGLGESPSTVYRVLVTLEARGIVDFDAAAQIWMVGARAYLIGAAFLRRTSLVERARPVLRELMESTGETANLGIERDGQVLFVSQVECHANIRAFFPPGTLSHMHASGIGKVLLAHMPRERVIAIAARHGLPRFTPSTYAEPQALLAELAVTRSRGFAVDAEEKNLGMRCIAAPVRDIHGETVAGISISGPSARIPEERTSQLARAVRDAAVALSTHLGAPADRGAPSA